MSLLMSSILNISFIQRTLCLVTPELQCPQEPVFDTLVLCSLISPGDFPLTTSTSMQWVSRWLFPSGSSYSIVPKCSYLSGKLFWLLSLKYSPAGIYRTNNPHSKSQVSCLLKPIVIQKNSWNTTTININFLRNVTVPELFQKCHCFIWPRIHSCEIVMFFLKLVYKSEAKVML